MMDKLEITIINESSSATDDQIKEYIPALQTQITRDFAPIWNIDAELSFASSKDPKPDTLWLAILEVSDQQGVLGYHDTTNTGKPLGKVFAGTDKMFGSSLSVTISHELLEMLADPTCQQYVELASLYYFLEVCDAVESDDQGYKIGNVLVSNFVTPAYFHPIPGKNEKYDFLGKLHAPLSAMLPGGYMAYCNPRNGESGQITSRTSSKEIYKANPYVGSRRYKRMMNKLDWIRSEVK